MKRTTWTVAWGFAFGLFFAFPIDAQTQPQQGNPQPQQIEQFVHQSLPVEGILGYLAFSQNLGDERLVKVCKTLRQTHEKRQEMANQVQQGQMDVQHIQKTVMELRTKMVVDLSNDLTDAQTQSLKQALGIEDAPSAQPGTPAPPRE